MNENVIRIENLVKYFDGRCVLDGINLKVPQGCIYGLLGRNAAGKTTIIRILLGLEPPTRGQTFLLGAESTNISSKVHGQIGYVAEGHNLIQNYKVGRLVKLCKDLSEQWNDEFFNHLTETFRLPMNQKVRELSIGMRAKLNLSLAMAIEPELLILDDPTLGLDTVARRQFLELAIDVIQKQGRTILLSELPTG
jgi:ABC-2 type transport system ATP-binding protein